jgi:CheY-like chemotaxis protein
MHNRDTTILFIEDETAIVQAFTKALKRRGYIVITCTEPDEAMDVIRQNKRIDAVVTDLQLPMEGCTEFSVMETSGGQEAGLAIARELRKRHKRLPIIFWSNSYSRDLRKSVLELGNCRFIPKTQGAAPVLDGLEEILDGFNTGSRPKTFIVHGHDETTMRQFKDYLTDGLQFPEPLVLRDMPSQGKTVIEKLESYTHNIDLVFVLLTPDDSMATPIDDESERFRSRQNVIFEMGYFLGALGRNTGRVILLYKGNVELPSDIWGMVSIDISDTTNGFDGSAAEELKREVAEWL